MGAGAHRGPSLPTFPVFAAWGWVICCVGYVWEVIVWFKLCAAINSASGTNRCQGIAHLVPIWGGLHMADVCATMNEMIEAHGLPVQPVKNQHVILNILLPSITFASLITTWNEIAAAANAR